VREGKGEVRGEKMGIEEGEFGVAGSVRLVTEGKEAKRGRGGGRVLIM